jgi:thiamine-phosphate pyrophosphorylase
LPAAADKPIVCYVTDRKSLGPGEPVENLLAKIRAAVEAHVDWIQIREKDLPARELLALAQESVGITKTLGGKTQVLVNDWLDVALAAGAAGVHLGRESVPATEVVKWSRAGNAPPGFLIGVSCHSLEETREAEKAGADYVFFGPIYDTPSKRAFGEPQGIARLKEASAGVRIPVIAIGGVNERNAAECLRAGAAGIAAIRMFQEAKDGPVLGEILTRLHGGN